MSSPIDEVHKIVLDPVAEFWSLGPRFETAVSGNRDLNTRAG